MAKGNGPGILIRVSHLILIQIFFIFSALALILFYPEEQPDTEDTLLQMEPLAEETAEQVFEIVESFPDSLLVDSTVLKPIWDYMALQPHVVEYSLAVEDQDQWYILTNRGQKSTSQFLKIHCEYCDGADQLLRANDEMHMASLSTFGDMITYYYRTGDSLESYLLRFSLNIVPPVKAGNNLPEIILLLFLVSTLISLLIINLISSGVKKPLKAIIGAFEDMSAGQDIILPEDAADPDIRQLTYAFNEMSQSLKLEKKKLAEANAQLLKANQSLLESESILTALVDYSPDAIIVTDLDDQVIIYNQTAARDFGYNQSNLTGKKISNLFSLSQTKKKVTDETHNHLGAKEVICRRSDNIKFPALLVSTPLGPEGSMPIAMLYFFRNISESRNYQDMVLKLDRIASKGKMARDIAHEINNYLAILQGNLELLPMIIAKNDHEKIDDRLKLLRNTVNNISTFTEGLTRFSDENSEFQKEDLNQLIENLIAFLKPQNKFDDIFIGTNLSEYLPMVTIDSSQIQLVITNILTNAAEALAGSEDGKWIAVSTALDETETHVYIKIANSGPGIDSKYVDNLFVKRFSTKKDGNGLGLITCKNIIDNHNGEISFHSTHESQAVFVIRIPVSREVENSDDTVTMNSEDSPTESINVGA